MNVAADILEPILSAIADLLLIALAGIFVLWIVVRLRRISESWQSAQRISMNTSSRPCPAPRKTERGRHAAGLALIIGGGFLLCAAAYASLRLIPETFQYFEVKRTLARAHQSIRFARWQDSHLRCLNNEPLGIQLQRLDLQPQVYVLAIRWDTLPPRYEVVVSGRTSLVEGAPEGEFRFHIDVGTDGAAELRGATLHGQEQALDAARSLLVAACDRSFRSEANQH